MVILGLWEGTVCSEMCRVALLVVDGNRGDEVGLSDKLGLGKKFRAAAT